MDDMHDIAARLPAQVKIFSTRNRQGCCPE
jgi:hypothetical protein